MNRAKSRNNNNKGRPRSGESVEKEAKGDMPASSTDNCAYIEETLKSSIAGRKNIDNKLSSSSKRILVNKIEFKPAQKSHSLEIDKLKGKYIDLNPSKDPSVSTSSDGTSSGNTMLSSSESGESLPAPKIILYPEENIKLEWQRLYRVGAGLINMGNTCFLNSTLQCLTYTPPLVNYCLSNEHSDDCQQSGFCMMCEIQRHIKRSNENAGSAIRPQSILQKIKMIAKHMSWGRQEDAHEFLRYVVDAMQRSEIQRFLQKEKHHAGNTVNLNDMGMKKKRNDELDKFSKETTVVNQIFGGFLRSQVQCLRCKEKSNTYDPFMDVSLDIRTAQTLEKAFAKYVAPETLDNDNAYMCTRCKQRVPAVKKFSIHKAPNVLTVSLKRFEYHRNSGKISRFVGFPPKLDLKPYMSNKQGDPIMYDLYAVLVHSGFSSNAGHYYCYIKSASQVWYCMNDSIVYQVPAERVLETEAYLLFYVKSSVKPEPERKKPEKEVLNNHVINNKKPKVFNGMTGHPCNDLGTLINRNGSNAKPKNGPKLSASATPLPDKREKVAFGIKPNSVKKSQQEGSGDATPRIVMQIKNGKVTTYEKSPNGKSKIVNGPDNRPGLVPYGDDSDSESENKIKSEKRKRSPPKVEKEETMIPSPKKLKETPEKKLENTVVFDKKLNATTSVPGNTNLLETTFGKHKRFNHDMKSLKKLDGLNLMISKPKESLLKFEKECAPFMKHLENSTSITCSTAGTLHLGKPRNSTTNWQVMAQDADPSPSVGSSSSKDSVNSTTEWHVKEKEEVLHFNQVPERQFQGWKVTDDKLNSDINCMSERSKSTFKENSCNSHDHSYSAKHTEVGEEKTETVKPFVSDFKSLLKTTGHVEPSNVISKSDTYLLPNHVDLPDMTNGGDSYVSVSDKQSLLSSDDGEHRRLHKKHKKHKKRNRSHSSDVKYQELINESDDASSETKAKKHKKKKKHKRGKKDVEDGKEHGSKKYKVDQAESDDSGKWEWVEVTKDSVDKTKNNNNSSVPSQTWDHHVTDGYKRQRNGLPKDHTSNGWDGCKSSKVAEELEKQFSANGYGVSVNSWDGGLNSLDTDIEKDRQKEKKRRWSDDYDEEFDTGKIKKVKKSHSDHDHHHSHNPFQSVQDEKNKWKSKEPVKSQSYHGYSNSSHHHHSNHHQSNHHHKDHSHGYHSSLDHSHKH